MNYIYPFIDNKEHLNLIKNTNKCFFFYINNNYNNYNNCIKLIYINNFENNFILTLNKNLKLEEVEKFINNFNNLYTINLKYHLNYIKNINLSNITDMNFYISEPINIIDLKNLLSFKYKYKNEDNIVISQVKHLEILDNIFKKLDFNNFSTKFNNSSLLLSQVYNKIENINNEIEYNIYKQRTFPKKTDKPEYKFKGEKLSIDFSCYQPTLLAKQMNFIFKDYIYKEICNYSNIELTKENKTKILASIFSKDENKINNHPFFNKVKEFSTKLYNNFLLNDGYLYIKDNYYKINTNKEITPNLLLNYYCSYLEKIYTLLIINELQNQNINIVYNNYDEIIIDSLNIQETLNIFNSILNKEEFLYIKYKVKNI